MFNFKVVAKSSESRARAGTIRTERGVVETPVFMPVGTLGSVKSVSPEELLAVGTQIVLESRGHVDHGMASQSTHGNR